MRTVEKFKLNKQHITLIVCAAILLVLIIASIILNAVIAPLVSGMGGTDTTPPELIEGEAMSGNTMLAFPTVPLSRIRYVSIVNEDGYMDVTTDEYGRYWFGYGDSYQDLLNGKGNTYIPPIVDSLGDSVADSFYATDSSGMTYTVSQLLANLGNVPFSTRIELPSTDTEEGRVEYEQMLRDFGFTKSEVYNIGYTYILTDDEGKLVKDEDGKYVEGERVITLGGQPISSAGYYFMVDDRNYIYYTAADSLGYALYSIESYIAGNIIASPLESDGMYASLLTSDYKQWKNTVVKTTGTTVTEDVVYLMFKGAQLTQSDGEYVRLKEDSFVVDLGDSESNPDYDRVKNLLVGNTGIKVYYDSSKPGADIDDSLLLTVLQGLNSDSEDKLIDLDSEDALSYSCSITEIVSVYSGGKELTEAGTLVGGKNKIKVRLTYKNEEGVSGTVEDAVLELSTELFDAETLALIRAASVGVPEAPIEFDVAYAKYSYTVTDIESVITDKGESDDEGYLVGENDLVKVTYTYSVNGVPAGGYVRHAVLDLSSGLVPAAAEALIRGAAVGHLSSAIEFDITYTKENSLESYASTVITAISGIFDSSLKELEEVVDSEDCYVTYSFYNTLGGVAGDVRTRTVCMGDEGQDALKAALLGQTMTHDTEIIVSEAYRYFEAMRNFVTYEVYEITQFVTAEQIISFRYANYSEREDFFGESIYKNTLEGAERLYGINEGACEGVLSFLCGTNDDSTGAEGLSGETVKIGLNAEAMDYYKLYANTLYIELPRKIEEEAPPPGYDENSDEMLDYIWYGVLGFTLHISDAEYDSESGQYYRYVGCEEYDLVAKIWGTEFDYLEKSFEDFWARKAMVLISIESFDKLTFDFNMEDVDGTYEFDFEYTTRWTNAEGTISSSVKTDVAIYERKDVPQVYITAQPGKMQTELGRLLEEKGVDMLNVSYLYDRVHKDRYDALRELYGTVAVGSNGSIFVSATNTLGAENFAEAFEMLQYTQYRDDLTDEERASVTSETESLMKMTLSLTNGQHYEYEFYRISDRKVMVTLRTVTDVGGNPTSERVSSFYLSTFAFKKLVSGFVGVLNGEIIDKMVGYPEYMEQ